MKWFDETDSKYEMYKERFGGSTGFCRCDSPWQGTPPNCKYSCGLGLYRDVNASTIDKYCKECPHGTSCDDPLTTIEEMKLDQNYWRIASTSLQVKSCPPNTDWCAGGSVAGEQGNGYCITNHRGPYCSQCQDGFVMLDGRCVDCDSLTTNNSLVVVLVGSSIFLILILVYKKSSPARKFVAQLNTRSMIVKVRVRVCLCVICDDHWLIVCNFLCTKQL